MLASVRILHCCIHVVRLRRSRVFISAYHTLVAFALGIGTSATKESQRERGGEGMRGLWSCKQKESEEFHHHDEQGARHYERQKEDEERGY